MNESVTYKINFKAQWLKLFTTLSKLILGFVLFIFIIKSMNKGLALNDFIEFLFISIIAGFIAGVASIIITFFISLTKVTLIKSKIKGVNYWGFKKSIEISNIKEIKYLSFTSKNDVLMIVSQNDDSILLSINTKNINELLSIINKNNKYLDIKTND
tara:strand:- start:11 stop:481 length:471 start_codon:yes stop_codon:yes gene_type:complete